MPKPGVCKSDEARAIFKSLRLSRWPRWNRALVSVQPQISRISRMPRQSRLETNDEFRFLFIFSVFWVDFELLAEIWWLSRSEKSRRLQLVHKKSKNNNWNLALDNQKFWFFQLATEYELPNVTNKAKLFWFSIYRFVDQLDGAQHRKKNTKLRFGQFFLGC